MAMFYLVRHGDTGVSNMISGRMSGVHLTQAGREQAQHLADRFSDIPADALYSSPLERALETAHAIATVLDLPVRIAGEITEIDYGDWTGKSFDDLSPDPRWQFFNSFRSAAQIPHGENMIQVQSRFLGWMEQVRRDDAQKRIVVVSHQDPIRAVVTYYAGLHVDMFYRFDISHASVTVIEIENSKPRVLTLNNVRSLPR
ncbi:MAG: hypothetical protein DMG14_11915 [Acidobacteria bacterium]|nr:MAG: hypothetical protein DMG14_11915 [Acidobacteriota bacterium]